MSTAATPTYWVTPSEKVTRSRRALFESTIALISSRVMQRHGSRAGAASRRHRPRSNALAEALPWRRRTVVQFRRSLGSAHPPSPADVRTRHGVHGAGGIAQGAG